jgi:hypothetical protein
MFAFFEKKNETQHDESDTSDDEPQRKRRNDDDSPLPYKKPKTDEAECPIEGVDKETYAMMKQLEAEEDAGQFRGLKGQYASAACAYHMRDAVGRIACKSALICGKKHPVHVGDHKGPIVAMNYRAVIVDEHGSWIQLSPGQLLKEASFRQSRKRTGRMQEYSWIPVVTKDGFEAFFAGTSLPEDEIADAQPISAPKPVIPPQPSGNPTIPEEKRKAIATTNIRNQPSIATFFKQIPATPTVAKNHSMDHKTQGDAGYKSEKQKPKHARFARGFYYMRINTIWAMEHLGDAEKIAIVLPPNAAPTEHLHADPTPKTFSKENELLHFL